MVTLFSSTSLVDPNSSGIVAGKFGILLLHHNPVYKEHMKICSLKHRRNLIKVFECAVPSNFWPTSGPQRFLFSDFHSEVIFSSCHFFWIHLAACSHPLLINNKTGLVYTKVHCLISLLFMTDNPNHFRYLAVKKCS